jgi:signal peptidase
MLGGLSKPENRFAYIQRAAELAPEDERVQKALIWARGQMRKEAAQQQEELVAPAAPQPGPVAASPDEFQKTQPIVLEFEPVVEAPASSFREEAFSADKNAGKEKKPLKWLQTFFTILFIVITLFLLGTGIYAMLTGAEPNIFGYQMMTVGSGSMEPTFMTGSIVVINTNENQDYQVGDVAMFWTPEDPDRNITHRIINIYEQDGQLYYQTQGDNNNAPDQEPITIDQIRGKYANLTVPYLGYFLSFIKSRDGILLLVALLGLYLVVTQGVRIRKLMKEDAENMGDMQEEA